jgi:hypothetical protein
LSQIFVKSRRWPSGREHALSLHSLYLPVTSIIPVAPCAQGTCLLLLGTGRLSHFAAQRNDFQAISRDTVPVSPEKREAQHSHGVSFLIPSRRTIVNKQRGKICAKSHRSARPCLALGLAADPSGDTGQCVRCPDTLSLTRGLLHRTHQDHTGGGRGEHPLRRCPLQNEPAAGLLRALRCQDGRAPELHTEANAWTERNEAKGGRAVATAHMSTTAAGHRRRGPSGYPQVTGGTTGSSRRCRCSH